MEHKETQINELYPIMPEWEPSAPPLDGGQSYRLQKKLMRSKEFSKMNVKNVIILAKNIIKQLKSSVI